MKLSLIEFNEANFDLINQYISSDFGKSRWHSLRKVLAMNSVTTSAEESYNELEPWIQWVSVHTGKTAKEHEVFRLGDIQSLEGLQLYEQLEGLGLKVGAISPMNTLNVMKNPMFFLPDPWVSTKTDKTQFSKLLHKALQQAVNDNATGKITVRSFLALLYGLILRSSIRHWPLYLRLLINALNGKKWCKALFLDLFLADLYVGRCKKSCPDFASLFMNGFAHIQHHYFFASHFYDGFESNPVWYIKNDEDPFVIALDVYDRIFESILRSQSDAEILVCTGLRQIPYDSCKYYYRLREHEEFLTEIGLSNFKVYPRMTRDFLVEFCDDQSCLEAYEVLSILKIGDVKVFGEIDNRGKSLFVTLTFPLPLQTDTTLIAPDGKEILADKAFAFVAIKNGMHDSKGYAFTNRQSLSFQQLNNKHVSNIYDYIKMRCLVR